MLPTGLLLGLLWTVASPATADGGLFVDRADEVGLDFVHWNGMSGRWYFPEINGSGAALFDADGDGDLDLYLAQGAHLGSGDPVAPPKKRGDRLYRNDLRILPDGSRQLAFTDVTGASGLAAEPYPSDYGMAVATGDFDNDGRVDLYVANYGANRLWRNLGGMRFEEVAGAWRAGDRRWSSTAVAVDVDRDGWLDLYVGNYLKFDPATQRPCSISTGQRDYCHPSTYPPEPDLLLLNTGASGRPGFIDASSTALPDRGRFPTLGAVAADLDGDGWADLYVANDDTPNQLWRNLGPKATTGGATEVEEVPGAVTFVEDALLAGSAVNGRGKAEASMGIDAGDADGDGDLDLFMTHLDGQTNTLFANDGGGTFRDVSSRSGLGPPSLATTGFGTGFLDIDNDGDLDLFAVNGAVQVMEELARNDDPFPFHQRDLLLRNRGGGVFEDISAEGGDLHHHSAVSRGAAMGDVDNDGDTDLVVVDNHGPVRLLINTVGQDRPWLGVRLVDRRGRDALGAVATLRSGKGPGLLRRVRTDGGYASAHDPRIRFGLGGLGAGPRSLDVRWPDGSRETFPAPAEGRYTMLVQGSTTAEGSAKE
ncbi:MAG: CRTAC1 family protein [Acidobacteriota bacterium]